MVKDAFGNPVPGVSVTFAAPASGASATLTGSPAVTAADGQASVTATANGIAGSYIVSATASGASVAASFSLTNNHVLVSIAVSPGNPALPVGFRGQFTATGTYSDGSTANITSLVTWASATPSVATISGTGLATALVPGTSAITASMAGVTGPGDTLTVIPSTVVNTTADTADSGFSSTISLRDAIAAANAVPDQTITFDPTVFAAPDDHVVARPARAEQHQRNGDDHGPGGGRDGQRRRERAGCSRSTRVSRRPISGLTITGGKTTGQHGGGVYNNGGMLTLYNVTISGNSANTGGGGLGSEGGTTTLTNCTVSGNTGVSNGGGVVGYGGTMYLTNCTLFGNTATGGFAYGGGMWANGTTTLTDCTVSGNYRQRCRRRPPAR